jgi:imidazole glycerol-phosphate synthase subunit HisH
MITIIDYGLGNIQAFVNVYRRLHIPVCVAKTADELKGATRLILPGVGAFDHAIEKLDASGMRPTLIVTPPFTNTPSPIQTSCSITVRASQ